MHECGIGQAPHNLYQIIVFALFQSIVGSFNLLKHFNRFTVHSNRHKTMITCQPIYLASSIWDIKFAFASCHSE